MVVPFPTQAPRAEPELRVEPERRLGQDRRLHPRGGRRLEDLGGEVSAERCDGCGTSALEIVTSGDDYDEYRCRRCQCRVFSLRSARDTGRSRVLRF